MSNGHTPPERYACIFVRLCIRVRGLRRWSARAPCHTRLIHPRSWRLHGHHSRPPRPPRRAHTLTQHAPPTHHSSIKTSPRWLFRHHIGHSAPHAVSGGRAGGADGRGGCGGCGRRTRRRRRRCSQYTHRVPYSEVQEWRRLGNSVGGAKAAECAARDLACSGVVHARAARVRACVLDCDGSAACGGRATGGRGVLHCAVRDFGGGVGACAAVL